MGLREKPLTLNPKPPSHMEPVAIDPVCVISLQRAVGRSAAQRGRPSARARSSLAGHGLLFLDAGSAFVGGMETRFRDRKRRRGKP